MDPIPVPPPAGRDAGFGKFFIMMVLCVVLIFGLFSILGCDSNGNCPTGSTDTTESQSTGSQSATRVPIESNPSTVNRKTSYAPGDRVEIKLQGAIPSGQGDIVWYPPEGARNFTFPSGSTPEPGGPPFVFKNLPASQISTGFNASYEIGIVEAETGMFRDNVSIQQGEYKDGTTLYHFQDYQKPDSAPVYDGAVVPLPAEPGATTTIWQIVRWTDIYSTLNTTVCQQIVDEGKSAGNFMTWQIPVATQTLPNEPYRLPVVVSPEKFPKLILSSGFFSQEIPLEVRYDATNWANDHLPAVNGALWVSLGVPTTTTITCVTINRDSWSAITVFSLDLGDLPGACANCSLSSYSCYDTGTGLQQMVKAQVLRQMNPDEGVATFADGTTCVGPGHTQLLPPGTDWRFEPYTFSIDPLPGETLDAVYWITNYSTTTARTYDLSFASSLPGATWTLYYGSATQPIALPDLTRPVGAQTVVATNSTNYMHLVATMPASVAAGQYAATLTAACATATPTLQSGGPLILVNGLPSVASSTPDVTITGGAVKSAINPGSPATFTLSVTNTGDEPLTSLVVTDTLPLNTAYTACSGGDSCAFSAGKITWNLASLGTMQTHVFLLTVQPDSALPPGSQISNTTYTVVTGNGVSDSGATVNIILAATKVFMPLMIIRQ